MSLLDANGLPVSEDIRRALLRPRAAKLTIFPYLVRFGTEEETFYALGCDIRLQLRHRSLNRIAAAGYQYATLACFSAPCDECLLRLLAQMASTAPYHPQKPIEEEPEAHFFRDPWPVIGLLPKGTPRPVPSFVRGYHQKAV